MTDDRARPRRQRASAILILAFLSLVAPIPAQSEPSIPARNGFVVDAGGIIGEKQEQKLAKRAEEIKRQTGTELVVVTLPGLRGQSIEAWGRALGNGWKVGGSQGNGVLLIVAPNDRELRIEVGDAVTAKLSDGAASAIVRNVIIPKFRSGEMTGGIFAGVDAIAEALSPSSVTTAGARSGSWSFSRDIGIGTVGALSAVLAILIVVAARNMRSTFADQPGAWTAPSREFARDPTAGGGSTWQDDSDSGSWSFGGSSESGESGFSGGGASGKW